VINQGIKPHHTHLIISHKTLVLKGAYLCRIGAQNTFQANLA